MTQEFVLLSTAATVGFLHTITGPDHYLPFAVLAKSRKWSHSKTTGIILLCGLGHIGSSVAIGIIGLVAGVGVNLLTNIDSARGEVAAWLLMIFGLLYFTWGLHKALLQDPPANNTDTTSLTPWVLFIIFIFGPCETLIPIIIYPGAEHNFWLAAGAAVVFSLVTIITMLVAVFSTLKGISFFRVKNLSRFSHAIAGFVIFLCGFLITFAGL